MINSEEGNVYEDEMESKKTMRIYFAKGEINKMVL
jgi:hypothetical protein